MLSTLLALTSYHQTLGATPSHTRASPCHEHAAQRQTTPNIPQIPNTTPQTHATTILRNTPPTLLATNDQPPQPEAHTTPTARATAAQPSQEPAPTPTAASFQELAPHLHERALQALAIRRITTPTPIQRAAIPRIAAGEHVLLHAETGSGKSLAFLLPTLPTLPDGATLLLLAPTRELALQLAAEAAQLVADPSDVQLVAVGSSPPAAALLAARALVATPAELLDMYDVAGGIASAVDVFLSQLGVLILDELDTLLPVSEVYGPAADKRKRRVNKRAPEPPAQLLLRRALELCARPSLQVVAASATVSRPSRNKLARVLRLDPMGRWFDAPPQVVRPDNLVSRDLSAAPSSWLCPPTIEHKYVKLPVRIAKLAPALPGRHEAALAAAARRRRPGGRAKPTLKEKRRIRAAKADAERRERAAQEVHPLLEALKLAIEAERPRSALVFLCRSSGLTVRRAAKQLTRIGVPATGLHAAVGLEGASSASIGIVAEDEIFKTNDDDDDEEVEETAELGDHERGSAQPSLRRAFASPYGSRESAAKPTRSADTERLRASHGALSERFKRQAASAEAEDDDTPPPLVVTFEDMARGLHFEGVEMVFILGLPDSPATYLHLAGRTGRQPVNRGTVVTFCAGNSHVRLCSWSERLGGVAFESLELAGLDSLLLGGRSETPKAAEASTTI